MINIVSKDTNLTPNQDNTFIYDDDNENNGDYYWNISIGPIYTMDTLDSPQYTQL